MNQQTAHFNFCLEQLPNKDLPASMVWSGLGLSDVQHESNAFPILFLRRSQPTKRQIFFLEIARRYGWAE